MDVRKKLVELIENAESQRLSVALCCTIDELIDLPSKEEYIAEYLITHSVTVQECAEWVHPKGYVVSNGFLCSKCGHEEASYYPINPRPGGGCIADENGNFYHPPKINYCLNCGAKMMTQPPKGE